jgi:hypothetical protein
MTDKSFTINTGKRHKYRVNFRMTLSFILDESGQVDGDFPIYTLKDSSGRYSKTLSAGNDLVSAGHYKQLLFDELISGTNYQLTRQIDDHLEEVVFENVPFATIVDQERTVHDTLKDHTYGEFDMDMSSAVDVSWETEATNGSR